MEQLCKVNELSPGKMKEFKIKNRSILVARNGNEFFAMHGLCPHQGASLSCGTLTGTNLPSDVGEYCYGKKGQVVRCPWHNHEFDVATGQSIHDPEKNKVKTYKIVVQGDDVLIDI